MARLIGSALICLAATGCVSQEKYNALKLDRDGLAEQLAKAQADSTASRAEAASYKDQLASLMQNGGNLQGLTANLQQQLAQLQAAYDQLNNQYLAAINNRGQTALPVELSSELQNFANQNPDLVDFDAARGIVKFKSDVTFSSGSAEVTGKAKEALTRFSAILNSPAASGYELLIAGHTDNTRVSNPATIQAGHKNNWYLSAHRAITVSEVMFAHNINPQRIGVVGYADQHPVASNGSESGRAQNRRVEVLILPTTVRSTGMASTPAKTAKPVNKDTPTVKIDNAPLNK
jgi:chemotaxis protein MotB